MKVTSERSEMRLIRLICWFTLTGRMKNSEIRELLVLEPVSLVTVMVDHNCLDTLKVKMTLNRLRRTTTEVNVDESDAREGGIASGECKVLACPKRCTGREKGKSKWQSTNPMANTSVNLSENRIHRSQSS